MLGALDSPSAVMDQIVHPLGKGILSIFSPTLAQTAEDIEVQQGWVNTPKSKADKAKIDDAQAKLDAAIAADAAAVAACATALTSMAQAASAPVGKPKTKADAKVAADQAAGDAAFAAQDKAAAAVLPVVQNQRVPPLQKGLAAATKALQKTPTDVFAQNTQKAWQIVLNKVLSTQPVGVGFQTERTMSLHMLGARSEIGIDWQAAAGGLLSTAGGVVKGYEDDKAAEKATSADKAKADAAIAADSAAAMAKATSLTSDALAASAPPAKAQAAQAKAQADQAALAIASQAQDQAAAAMPPTATALRVAAGQKSLAAATAKLQANPTDLFTQNLVKAWGWAMNKGQNAQIKDGGKPPAKEEGGLMALLKKPIVGPVTVGYAAAGVGVIGALWYAVKKGVFRRFGIG